MRHGETRKAFDVASDGIGGDMRVTSHGVGARAVWPTRRGAQARASCYEADEDDGQALDLREESVTADVLMRRLREIMIQEYLMMQDYLMMYITIV